MRTAVLTATLLAALLRPAPREARACGNSYTHFYLLSSTTRELDAAERALLQGTFVTVVRTANLLVHLTTEGHALRTFPRSFRTDNSLGADRWEANLPDEGIDIDALPAAAPDAVAPITVRARLLRAIGIARRDGQFNAELTPLRRANPAQREARFQTALDDIAAAVAANPTDTRARAYQAEIRARRAPGEIPAARIVLRDLARRDVLSDPWSWAQLARIEDNDAARAAARARCTAMAGRNAARACVP
ncbi:MAG: hypothetical protein U0325_29770 [Polyangiales bacterium]